MRKIFTFTLALLALTTFANGRNEHEVVLHHGSSNHGFNQIYVDPPRVTYDEELNELTVYFGSTGTVDIEYVDTAECSRAEPRSRLSLEMLKLQGNSPLS